MADLKQGIINKVINPLNKTFYKPIRAIVVNYDNLRNMATIRFQEPNGRGVMQVDNVPVNFNAGIKTTSLKNGDTVIVDFLNNSALTPRIVSLIDETYESTTRNDYTHLMQGGLMPCIKECYTNTVENPMINDLTVENEIVDIMNFKRYDLEKEIYKFGVNVGNYKDKDIGITNPYNKSTIIVKENGSIEIFTETNNGIIINPNDNSISINTINLNIDANNITINGKKIE